MSCVPEPGTTRVNKVITSSITIDKLQKKEERFELKSMATLLFYILFITSSGNNHLKIILIGFVYRFASSTTIV